MTTKNTIDPKNVKATLESKFVQDVIGSNEIKSNPFKYGQLGLPGGESAYLSAMSGEEANKIRQDIYTQKKQEGDKLGIAGEPAYGTNYDVSINIAKHVQEIMALGKLGDLEKSIGTVAKGFEFTVPEKLRNYSLQEILSKPGVINEEGKIDRSKLSEDEQKVFVAQQLLSQAYTLGVVAPLVNSNYFADLNAQAKELMDSYKPVEKPKK
ncbi:MAG: hypothetical protein KJ949_02455 [Nanoarchaeota archaeon]|nr:hypothetical protein [Nanoarchaeota archaeon]